ncbi:MAG TPA: ribosome silencing factor [Bryobacterales bacterium]|jgi:ribosome-associated protein|nr:ribosome silencing factor [Bryobacterales bacterium]
MDFWQAAVEAARSKKAEDISVLDLHEVASFTDTFVICSGMSARQNQAISDEVERKLKEQGLRPASIEGYQQAEWILMDYGDFIIHIFSPRARNYYELERLWKNARRIAIERAV